MIAAASLLFFAWIGHAAIWLAVTNRLNASGMPRPLVKSLTIAGHLLQLGVPAWVAVRLWSGSLSIESVRLLLSGAARFTEPWLVLYGALSLLVAAVIVPLWIWRTWLRRTTTRLVQEESRHWKFGPMH